MSLKSKKGVSPLIAAVLLIAFTVSVSMIIMGWFSTFTRTATANISATTTEAIGCNAASINIEHVYSSGTTGTIVVKNTGFKDVTVQGMIVNSTGGTCSNTTGGTLSKGSIMTLTISGCAPTDMADAYFDRAIVTTDCGGVDDVTTDDADHTPNS